MILFSIQLDILLFSIFLGGKNDVLRTIPVNHDQNIT